MPLREHAGDKDTIAVAPDGSWARVTTGERAWHYNRRLPIPNSIDSPVGQLMSSADGKWVLGLDDNTLRVQDAASGTTRIIRGHDKITHVQPLADGRIFTVGSEGSVRVTALGKPASTYGSHQQTYASFSANTRWVVVDPSLDVLFRYEIATGRLERIPFEGKNYQPLPVINDAGQLAAVPRDGSVLRYESTGSWKKLGVHDDAPLLDVRMLEDGTVLTLTSKSIAIWPATGSRRLELPGEATDRRFATMLQVSRDGRRVLVPCGDRHCLIDPTGDRVTPIDGMTGRAIMADDGSIALSGNAQGEHVVWDLSSLRAVKRFPAADAVFGVLGVSRDGARAVVRSATGVELVELSTLARTPLRSRKPLSLGWVLFSPDGKSLLDNTSMLWDVASGEGRLLGPRAHGVALDLLDDRAAMVTLGSIDILPDDLPREPAALSARLRAMRYQLDDSGTLQVR